MFNDIPILCVDRDLDSLETTMIWLKLNGCVATFAINCDEALELLEKQRFELCIVDYNLPDCTGVELCQKVRKKWPKIPFILNTGDVRQTVQSEAAREGMHFLPKPTDLDVLFRLVDNIVGCSSDKVLELV